MEPIDNLLHVVFIAHAIGKEYFSVWFSSAFHFSFSFEFFSSLIKVTTESKSHWDCNTRYPGDLVICFDFRFLPMWWICNKSIRWLCWWAVSMQLVFVPNGNSTNPGDCYVEYTKTTGHSWIRQHFLHTRCIQNGIIAKNIVVKPHRLIFFLFQL